MPEPWMVTLNGKEEAIAVQEGGWRRRDAIHKGRDQPKGEPKDDKWMIDIEAVGAEIAVAKMLDKFWMPRVGTDKHLGDVGDIEVKWTMVRTGGLIIEPDYDDHRVYVLVKGKLPVYYVCGWIYGHQGKLNKWTTTMREQSKFLVPANELTDIRELFKK